MRQLTCFVPAFTWWKGFISISIRPFWHLPSGPRSGMGKRGFWAFCNWAPEKSQNCDHGNHSCLFSVKMWIQTSLTFHRLLRVNWQQVSLCNGLLLTRFQAIILTYDGEDQWRIEWCIAMGPSAWKTIKNKRPASMSIGTLRERVCLIVRWPWGSFFKKAFWAHNRNVVETSVWCDYGSKSRIRL